MIINEIKPDLILEIGTFKGASALYFADLFDIIGKGEVHTINIVDQVEFDIVNNHNRIKLFLSGFEGYDTNNLKNFNTILIIDDGSHKSEDVINAFNKFKDFVGVNSYYIIEDGVLSELGYDEDYNGGPLKVIDQILKENNNYIIDHKWCDFYGKNTTFNPNGYLKRIS